MAQTARQQEHKGFMGAVSGMSLADIIQVKGVNRFSGCLIVEHQNRNGIIFFRDGEVVHAEQEGLAGEEAFYAIMGWAGGTFRSEPKILTTSRTIEQPLSFLVLEALRRMDESNANKKHPPAAGNSPQSRGVRVSASDISQRLKAIVDVEHALIMTKEGAILDDNSYQAEFVAASGLFLASFASRLGSPFGFGELKSATAHGSEHHFFLFDSKRHHLCISAKGSSNANAMDAEIRQLLSKK